MLQLAAVESVCRVSAALARSDTLVIDADTHITDVARLPELWRRRYLEDPHYYHGRPISAEDLIGEMDLCGVDMALCWQDPASTFYGRDCDANAEALLAANRYVFEAARRFPDRILPAGWTDPKACGVANAIRVAEICVCEFGFFIIKMNPAQNAYPIASPEVAEVVARIVELGAVPAFHFGADTPYTPASGLERLLEDHPGHPFIGVHMGGGGASYQGGESLAHEARELGLRRSQLRYILSTKRDTHMERDILTYQKAGPPFSENLFCASDAPYGRMAWNFGGFREMLRTLEVRHPDHFGPEASANYLGRNLTRFALEGLRNLLRTHGIPEPACR